MKIAIISDIHGNLPALKAVLSDCDRRKIDQVICLGDLVDFAPWPNEVIELIREQQIITMMGNHDERVAFDLPVVDIAIKSEEETIARRTAIAHSKRTISPDNKEFLKSLPRNLVLTFADTKIYFTHAGPDEIDQYIFEKDTVAQDNCLAITQADVYFMGHTHLPFINERKRGVVVNVGSVGKTKEIEKKLAVYALIEIKDKNLPVVEIIRIPYPVDEAIEGIYKSEIPNYYAEEL